MKKNVLLFEDIIDDLKNTSNHTWQILYDFTKGNGNDNARFSALIKNTNVDIEPTLKDFFRNELDLDFSRPPFHNREDEVYYESDYYNFGVYYEPIVIYQYYENYWETQIDLCEEFKLYHSLYFDSQKQEYLKINKNGDKEIVAVVETFEGRKRLKVKTSFLRDYLAAKEMVCVLYYDIRRIIETPTDKNKLEIEEHTEDFHYKIFVNPEDNCSEIKTHMQSSIIIGKSILYPFLKPKHPDFLHYIGDKPNSEPLNMIIDCDDNGEYIYADCMKDHYPSPYFSDAPIHHLTPIFFKKDVLEKYYENTDKYSVEPEIIRCGEKWTLSFNINEAGLVHVYLGDLAKIPDNEKHHWKQYNVAPEGKISDVSYKRDFLAEPADTEDIIHILKNTYQQTNELWKECFSFNLFHPLREGDQSCFESLMVPPTDLQLKFDRQILSLSKIFPDSLNKSALLKTMNIDEEDIKKMLNIPNESTIGSIKVFQAFLIRTLDFDIEESEKLVFPLTKTQTLRSYSAAHRKGKAFAKISNKFGLNNISNADFLEKLFSDFVETLQTLQKSIVQLKK